MTKKIAAFLAAVMIFILPCEAYSAKSYALVEMSTGRMLTGFNINKKMPMASTTKIMTGLLACESGKFDQVFTVPEEAIRVEGSSMGLVAGEKITLRDLTYGLLLESGNDAANTIAYCLGGSVPDFVGMMNKRASQLHLQDTHFVTPSGLDDKEHFTTAIDLARLGAYAMQNQDFERIVSTERYRIPYNGIENGRTLYNHNELLKSYEGAIGIKTGFTKKSGRCLVSSARRNGITLVAVTLNGPDDWNDHKALLNYGFSILKSCPLFTSYPEIRVAVTGGNTDAVSCSYNTGLCAGLRDNERARVKMKISVAKTKKAPVAKGQKMGEIIFTLDQKVLARTDVVADESVEAKKTKPFLPFFNFFKKE